MDKKNVLVLHGPNLNLLGIREPDVYGAVTLEEIDKILKIQATEKGYHLRCLQANSQGALVTAIHEAIDRSEGILINPAGYTHTSVVLLDALKAFSKPKVEVHLTNLYKREHFRHKSVTAAGVDGVVSGFGADGYGIALNALIHLIETRSSK